MSLTLPVRITANASRNEIVGWQCERLKIKIKAPAVEGKANQELLRFLAGWLDVRQSDIQILRGETSRTKLLSVGIDEDVLRSKLGKS
jgi:uncharacterized protein